MTPHSQQTRTRTEPQTPDGGETTIALTRDDDTHENRGVCRLGSLEEQTPWFSELRLDQYFLSYADAV